MSASAVTAPSHMTMFTGLQPSAHGVKTGFEVLPQEISTLAEMLRPAGITTAAFTENGFISASLGFARGFDSFREDTSSYEGAVERTFAGAAAWLERHRDERFFLFVHTYQVHSPFTPPERYAALFEQPERLPRTVALYDREIRFVDDELRRLLASLEASGLADDTVVVLTSDHGEEFLDHGLLGHGGHLYQESVAVPLIFRGPGVPAGRRVETPVAQADLMPTILAIFGLSPPPRSHARSLLGLLRGVEDAGPPRPLYSEGHAHRQPAPGGWRRFESPTFAVRLGARKLIREPGDGRAELYDLTADPDERRNLLEQEPGAASELGELLERYLAEHRAAAGRAGAAPAPLLDPEREQKLRALGYLD